MIKSGNKMTNYGNELGLLYVDGCYCWDLVFIEVVNYSEPTQKNDQIEQNLSEPYCSSFKIFILSVLILASIDNGRPVKKHLCRTCEQ